LFIPCVILCQMKMLVVSTLAVNSLLLVHSQIPQILQISFASAYKSDRCIQPTHHRRTTTNKQRYNRACNGLVGTHSKSETLIRTCLSARCTDTSRKLWPSEAHGKAMHTYDTCMLVLLPQTAKVIANGLGRCRCLFFARTNP